MHCSNCGTDLPELANFCWRCGKPQRPGIQEFIPRLEFCEISTETIEDAGFPVDYGYGKSTEAIYRFTADVIGPNGRYIPFVSEPFQSTSPATYLPEISKILNELLRQLAEDGWEDIGLGIFWYSHRLMRRVES